MGGVFGVVSKSDCIRDLFYGTDYHSHLGTVRGGMAVYDSKQFYRFIHDITNSQFRSKFEDDLGKMRGNRGIGVISDCDDQPLIIGSHLGTYAIVTVGKINNLDALADESFRQRSAHYSEMSGGAINPTELVASLINTQSSFVDGIRYAQERIDGSCTLLLLTADGLYAARDRLGRTPLVIGTREDAVSIAMESCAFANLDYAINRDLGPGEIALIDESGVRQLQAPGDSMQICAFLWIYYGYPASYYEGINVESSRNNCGAALARADAGGVKPDIVAGIPDSGIGHALGYAQQAGIPFRRPFVKYTPTWPRSFMPQDQRVRDIVARMKLIPIPDFIRGKRLLFCEDSIVRGTQLKDTMRRLFDIGALEIHMRPACPPLVFGCKFLNFSRSRSVLDLATRIAILEIEGKETGQLSEYTNPDSAQYDAMVEHIRRRLALTSLRFLRLDDMVSSIGLPKEKLCTYCWTGCEGCR